MDLSGLFNYLNGLSSGLPVRFPIFIFNGFLFFLYIFYKYRIEKAENISFIDLLWRVFVTGLVTTIISLFFQLINILLGNTTLTENELFRDFIYIINLGLLSTVLISAFAVFRRLILYQKSKYLITVWKIFHYSLLLSLVYNVLPFTFLDKFFDYYLIFLIILGIVLSVNMKWVAYLNFKQKWKSILLVGLALFYLSYFTWTLSAQAVAFNNQNIPFTDFQENVFILALLAFVFLYTIFSLLVILFNLPTSSVFEQKLEEVVNFQKLSQSIQTEQSEERVYDILLESSVSTVFADAAWLELNNESHTSYYTHKISEKEIFTIKEHLDKKNVKGILDQGTDRIKNVNKVLNGIKGFRFRSLISVPVVVKNRQIGMLALLKEVSDGFNKEMRKIIDSFANQAGISIENFRLLTEALENERYKEELKIAKRVQDSLIPKKLNSNGDFKIVAFTKAAAEVGGDYYDTFRINDTKTSIIIGDVSGKGTSAAFHMAQMKGIFQSLSQIELHPSDFMVKANAAISQCLDKASFITATYFLIDKESKKVCFTRAGHCPTLFYNGSRDKTEYFQSQGIGLGILRNEEYKNYVYVNEMSYSSGDIMVLYTDGITEAQNSKGDEYGYERLEKVLHKNSKEEPELIREAFINDLYDFTGTDAINDDYTVVIIKFV